MPPDRPANAAEVAPRLPGGDAISAALAEGRVLPPEVVAFAGSSEPMAQPRAWLLLAAIFAGVLLVASRSELLTVSPAEAPKPPEVLAERAMQLLSTAGHDAPVGDRAFWFDSARRSHDRRSLRFAYRVSPRHLVPQNIFHYVTSSTLP